MYLVDDLVWYQPDDEGHTGEAFLTKSLGTSRSSEYIEDVVLMQFTGLHDKNGREVFEGDLLSNGWLFIGEVIFENGAFFSEDRVGIYVDRRAHGHRSDFSQLDVIGNIYDNPMLLTQAAA